MWALERQKSREPQGSEVQSAGRRLSASQSSSRRVVIMLRWRRHQSYPGCTVKDQSYAIVSSDVHFGLYFERLRRV